jgi:hypothetical protein
VTRALATTAVKAAAFDADGNQVEAAVAAAREAVAAA